MSRAAVYCSLLACTACGSGVTCGVIPRDGSQVAWTRNVTGEIVVATHEPRQPYDVIGTVEVRTSRPKSAEVLREKLVACAERLLPDAILPPTARAPDPRFATSTNQLRPFYVFDDGRTQVLEARAIRVRTTAPSEVK